MNQLERFQRRLGKTRTAVGKRLTSAEGPQIGETLERIRKIDEALDWTPKPGEPGHGTVSESTIRMAGGGLP